MLRVRNKKSEKRRRNIGKKARKKMPALLNKYGHQCYWCKKEIKSIKDIKSDYHIAQLSSLVSYLENGKVVSKLIASVDHVVGLRDGGTNDIDNLVPSCIPCNLQRARERDLLT